VKIVGHSNEPQTLVQYPHNNCIYTSKAHQSPYRDFYNATCMLVMQARLAKLQNRPNMWAWPEVSAFAIN